MAILVDDGMATGATQRAAVGVVRRSGAARCVVAVPVAAAAGKALRAEGIEAINVLMPDNLHAIGLWYEEFHQTTAAEVRELIDHAWKAHDPSPQ